MAKLFEITQEFAATPEALYKAWLDSDSHSKMTGGNANCSNQVGGVFTAWDNYITGKNKSLIPHKEIIQSWRTTEFLDTDDDSEITIRFEATEKGCILTLLHKNIPEGQSDYETGWKEHYFNPMQEYFSS